MAGDEDKLDTERGRFEMNNEESFDNNGMNDS
jgi:hypothetical protein